MINNESHPEVLRDPEVFMKVFHLEDNSVCDDLIEYFKDNHEYKQPGHVGSGLNEKAKKSTDLLLSLIHI